MPTLTTASELIGAVLALGAADVGDLSPGERELVNVASPTSPSSKARAALTRAIKAGEDPLGDAFCSIFDPDQRRPNGATYTPPAIVDAMLGWAAGEGTPDRVVDPGAGSGRFTLAAGRRFPKADLVAVEYDPLAALVLRANLAAAGLGSRADVRAIDYRELQLSKIEGRTLYLGNPPYVRHHQIEPGWKEWLSATAHAYGHRRARATSRP